VTPNDGHCHLDSHGIYTESLNQVHFQLMLFFTFSFSVELNVYNLFHADCNMPQ